MSATDPELIKKWNGAKDLKALLDMIPGSTSGKSTLEDYLIVLGREYAKERSRDAFRPYLLLMVGVGAGLFAVVFAFAHMIPGIEVFPNILFINANSTSIVTGEQVVKSDDAKRFELSFILGTSASAAAAIVFAALGGNAIQRQTDNLSALSFTMDEVSDRIGSIESGNAMGNVGRGSGTGGTGHPGNPPTPKPEDKEKLLYTKEELDKMSIEEFESLKAKLAARLKEFPDLSSYDESLRRSLLRRKSKNEVESHGTSFGDSDFEQK